MKSLAGKYFRHLALVREDIREELRLLGTTEDSFRICDFGCGQGLTTYGLALEVDGSECIGIDKFDGESSPTQDTLMQYVEEAKQNCDQPLPIDSPWSGLCRLISEKRLPLFYTGDIVLGQNLPHNVNLAYCKRVLINIFHGKHGNKLRGVEGVKIAVHHMVQAIQPGGWLLSVEFAGFPLDQFFLQANLNIIHCASLQRRDIRSRGRSTVISHYMLSLCQKMT